MMFLNACAWVFGSGALFRILVVVYHIHRLRSFGIDTDRLPNPPDASKSWLVLIASVLWLVFGGK